MKRSLLVIKDLKSRLKALQTEPIAIVGMSCRFPGGQDPEAFWQLLRDKGDAVREVPSERWDPTAAAALDPANPAAGAARWGGFVDGIDRFDATFFGISPREAERMDPQQRMLLEVAWEALEDAGQSPHALAGTSVGIFVGVYNGDYAALQINDLAGADAYACTGNSNSLAAGRLAYALDVTGPALVVDTVCSSSLVALHLACTSLRGRECQLAIVGGTNAIISPLTSLLISKLYALAPDGRCKAFDARANGFVRGEGCGVVVLKRLSDAERDGDPIWAVVRGSAVNQDGRSNGLTAPNAL
ncbi:MAG TPA: polyketide synthase, partial [Polyangiaceae bacterium]|nr:polyketide synthase [Polyangiaceae bacterium]